MANISGTSEVMPTDGKGGIAVALVTGGTTVTAISDTSITLVGATVDATVVAGTLILIANTTPALGGYWAVATAVPVAGVTPIDFWRKHGASTPERRNDGSPIGHIPPLTNATYKAFPATVLANLRAGILIKSVNFGGVATATLTLNGPTGAVGYSFPAAIASQFNSRYDKGLFFDGPFTIVPGTAAVIGQIEFVEGPFQ